ncbi:MAG: LLM class flavin-dependent oxidoreductase [Nitrospinota bacterium]|nr:MAG: LLM class flavin-dependent oxidoreductase [Nitrospinota bacterium]
MHTSSASVRFGIYLPSFFSTSRDQPSLQHLCAYAQHAEAVGFDSVWVIDHLIRAAPSYRVTWYEPFTVLSAVLAHTQCIALGTGILVLPLRHPVLTAKTVATLDVLSQGRVIFGVASGWHPQEFEACQVPLQTRGRRCDEALELMKRLWTEDRVTYQGAHFHCTDLSLEPKPFQSPHPPIWIGGGTWHPQQATHITGRGWSPQAVLRRIARLGNGLCTSYRAIYRQDTSLIRRDWEQICAYAESYGRDPMTITRAHQDHLYIVSAQDRDRRRAAEVVARYTPLALADAEALYLLGTPDQLLPRIAARVDAGIRYLLLHPLVHDLEQLDRFAEEIMPHFRP